MQRKQKSIFRANGSLPRFLTSIALNKALAKNAWNEFNLFSTALIKDYGERRAVKILKDLNNSCRHYACGYPKITRSLGGIWFRTNKSSGIPAKLKHLIEFIRLEPNIALAIPNSIYAIKLAPDISVRTVTEPSKATISDEEMADFEKFCKGHCARLLPSKVDINITLKGGPCGPSAISQIQDLVVVELCNFGQWSYHSLIKLIYGPGSWLETCYHKAKYRLLRDDISELSWPKREPAMITSKMEFLPGPAGKTRIIYIFNWWVQSLLLPLHDSLMNHFRIMKGDCTWNQEKGVELIRLWSAKGLKLYSFDLTAATDRWPVRHQAIPIKATFGDEIGEAWHYLMTRFAPYSRDHGKHVFYSVGQPMGAYSSWAALNLTHHMTVRYLAKKHRLPCKYMVLGDDLVIAGEKLAMKYRDYMCKLGVDINESKSLIYEEGKPSSAEFARNLVNNGSIIGTISPNLLTQIFEYGEDHMISELIREMKNKLKLDVIVTPDKILLPRALGALLSRKQKHNAMLILSIPVDYGQPVTLQDSGYVHSHLRDYEVIENPWKGLDKTHILNVINMRYIDEARVRLDQLNDLETNLQHGRNVTSGYMLEWEEHPINYMVSNLKEELSMQAMKVSFLHPRSKVVPGLIQTSIDLLLSVLTKGESYREWRDSKSNKARKISNFIKGVHKDAPKEFIAAPTDWTSWASAWENQA